MIAKANKQTAITIHFFPRGDILIFRAGSESDIASRPPCDHATAITIANDSIKQMPETASQKSNKFILSYFYNLFST